jgi:hypothetical protein
MTIVTDEAFASYLVTALATSMDSGGRPLYDGYDIDDFDSDETLLQRSQCEDFLSSNSETINYLLEQGHDLETILHDFWLTRCGHGAGFWDGDYPEPYDRQLTEAAKVYGNVDIYVGDDGILYFS